MTSNTVTSLPTATQSHKPASAEAVGIYNRQWVAHLQLSFAYTPQGTQLIKAQRQGPLSVQKAFYPEGRDCAHIYLLHPPAGIVSGDTLKVAINANDQAHVLVTTPGANRFYRARESAEIGTSKQQQMTELTLTGRAQVENFPQETIVYEGADGFNKVDIHLSSEAVYLGWDITCLGLPASEQHFEQGRYTQLNRIFIDNKLVLHDRIGLTPENELLTHTAGLGGYTVFGSFLVAGSNKLNQVDRTELVDNLRVKLTDLNADKHVSITDIDGILVIRYLGHQAEQCKRFYIALWQIIRPRVCDKAGIQPRIWHT